MFLWLHGCWSRVVDIYVRMSIKNQFIWDMFPFSVGCCIATAFFVFLESRLGDCRLISRTQSHALLEIDSLWKNPGAQQGSNDNLLKRLAQCVNNYLDVIFYVAIPLGWVLSIVSSNMYTLQTKTSQWLHPFRGVGNHEPWWYKIYIEYYERL